MNKKILALLIAATFVLLGCEKENKQQVNKISVAKNKATHIATQTDIDNIAKNLQVNYRVITNIVGEQCDQKIANGACFEVELKLTAKEEISADGWGIYFSHIAPIQSFESDDFTVKHLNGDLHHISLKDGFAGFDASEEKTLLFRAMFWSLAESDAMPNYIVSSQGLSQIKPKIIESTRPYIDKDSGLEVLPHVTNFTDVNKHFKRSPDDKTSWLTSEALYQRNLAASVVNNNEKLSVAQAIIPTPKSVVVNESIPRKA